MFCQRFFPCFAELLWLVDLVVSASSSHINDGTQKKIREENLVPGHGQDFNTLFCTAWNEPKIALWNDWSRRNCVKNVCSYNMIRPTKKHVFYKDAWLTRKKSLQTASVCYKHAPGMEHGSSHFIVEMYTGIVQPFSTQTWHEHTCTKDLPKWSKMLVFLFGSHLIQRISCTCFFSKNFGT